MGVKDPDRPRTSSESFRVMTASVRLMHPDNELRSLQLNFEILGEPETKGVFSAREGRKK